jgi:putative Mg2+ transporter-C (MgtC) family protein
MAAGAGLWLLAVLVTAGHLGVMLALTPLAARLPRSEYAPSRLRLTYLDGRGALRRILELCTAREFTVSELSIERPGEDQDPRTVSVWLTVRGNRSISDLTAALAEIDGVLSISSDDANTPSP